MAEWALDWYDYQWYQSAGAACVDCANLTSGDERILRGGDWESGYLNLRAAYRWANPPDERFMTVGIRCAR